MLVECKLNIKMCATVVIDIVHNIIYIISFIVSWLRTPGGMIIWQMDDKQFVHDTVIILRGWL